MKKIKLLVLNTLILTSTVVFADYSTNTDTTKTIQTNQQVSTDTNSDTGITTSVKSAFLKEKLFGDADVSAFSISVETNNGIVHLTGTAKNQVQANNAVNIAKKVEGVKNVVNEIKIKDSNY